MSNKLLINGNRLNRILRISIGLFVLFSFDCRKSSHLENIQAKPNVVASVDTTICDSTEYMQPDIQTFYRASTPNTPSDHFKGTEKPLLYSSHLGKLLCYQNYYVICSGENTTEVFKRKGNQNLDSISISSDDSILIRYTEVGQWFEGIKGNYLFMDFGTSSTDHGISVIDLSTGSIILDNVTYLQNPLQINSTYTLTFFEVTGPATKENCPDYESIVANGDPPVIAEKVSLNLRSKVKKHLGVWTCFGLQ